jgi:hypothetical protein
MLGTENTAVGYGALTQNIGDDTNAQGFANTAVGTNALNLNATGGLNTAMGQDSMQNNVSGFKNTAIGAASLFANTTGSENTALGFKALDNNNADNNTAIGFAALFANATGTQNTATGVNALRFSTSDNNTAVGFNALENNRSGTQNTGTGVAALLNNVGGSFNTATGLGALESNQSGNNNTADGINALLFAAASNNTAIGANALQRTTSGSNNIGLGSTAGINLTTGSNNIDVGNPGATIDSQTIRIGTLGVQSRTFIVGIRGTAVTGPDVTVGANGQLGVLPSSARFKRDIHDMGETSSKLMKLRPVSFRYKNDPQDALQYGLVAEEVERVYPELVTYADGRLETVRYSMLTPMLLNELQKQTRKTDELAKQVREQTAWLEKKDAELAAQQHEIDALKKHAARINALSERLAALEQQVLTPQRLHSLASK